MGELAAPRGLGAVADFERLKRLAPAGPTLKASVAGPYTLSGRIVPGGLYADRFAVAEALVAIVRRELEGLQVGGPEQDGGDHQRESVGDASLE